MYRHDQKCKFLQREVSRNANTIAALPWQPMIGESQRKHAQEAALCVAERMRDPERVQKVAQVVRNQLQHPNRWSVFTPGNAGDMALLYNYVAKCFPGFGWETYAQRYLNLVALGTQQKSLLQPGLFTHAMRNETRRAEKMTCQAV